MCTTAQFRSSVFCFFVFVRIFHYPIEPALSRGSVCVSQQRDRRIIDKWDVNKRNVREREKKHFNRQIEIVNFEKRDMNLPGNFQLFCSQPRDKFGIDKIGTGEARIRARYNRFYSPPLNITLRAFMAAYMCVFHHPHPVRI